MFVGIVCKFFYLLTYCLLVLVASCVKPVCRAAERRQRTAGP